jgi:hypothetical protein
METMFSTKVRSRYLNAYSLENSHQSYLAINGIVSEVGGRILETSNRNTTNASRMLMPRVIFSEHSAGKKKTAILKNAIKTVGMIKMIV